MVEGNAIRANAEQTLKETINALVVTILSFQIG